MRRKVIQIAESTQLISLPRKWCIANNIKKGDELEISEEQDRLGISTTTGPKKQERVTVSIAGLGQASRALVSSLYKGGYDEFKVIFDSAEELRGVQDIVKDSCSNFEIVEQGKNYVVAKRISESIPEEFDSVLRRTFMFLKNMVEESYTAVEAGDANLLNTVIAMDSSINRFTYFCRRVLNKHGRGPYRVTSPLYLIVDELEEIADRYKYICRARLNINQKITPSLLGVFENVNKMVDLLTTLFYKFNWQTLNEIFSIKKSIDALVPALIQKIHKNEFPILLNLLVIADKIYELDGPLVLSRFDPTSSNAALK